MRKVLVCACLMIIIVQMLRYTPSVSAAPTDLKVYAEAASFARLDPIDPTGWFYQAVLYNPTGTDIVVTGLRWWYNASVKIIDNNRNARCYDTRYFSNLPTLSVPNDRTITWEYTSGSISITVPAKKMILTWIEVPTGSVNNDAILTTYYVQAYAGSQWISSPLCVSHSGHDDSTSTVFRADFNLATDPNAENQTLPAHLTQKPQWLFNEDRWVVAGLSSRVRLIPIASSRNDNGINSATVNVTLPSGWSYVSSSAYNPYGEAITYYSVGGRDRLRWNLNRDVLKYALNQSMAQNYIEFNVTAPSTPGIYNFTINASITSFKPRTTTENQYIYVVVRTPPTATFTFSPTKPLVNQSVTLNASSSYDLDGTIINYSWNFGDSQTATGMSMNHTYATFGNYTVTLTVTDNDGLKGTKSSGVQVIKGPVASFTFSPSSPLVNETVTFNATSSTPNGGSITSYFWDFGDSQIGSGVIITHAFTNLGNYTVVLNITDSEGLWNTEIKTINVRKTPTASFTYSPTLPIINQTVTFDASLSRPDGGFIVDYLWDFGDGGIGADAIVTHTYTNFGNFTVTLTISDSEGLSDTEIKVTRIGASPFASFTYSPDQPWLFSTITLNASSSRDSDGFVTSYQWDFGDGNVTVALNPIISHVYNDFGNFTVTLRILDNDGLNSSFSKTLVVVFHDVTILSVSPSATEVQNGQQVSVTVMVKNKGTTYENFTVTVYYNSTKLETQSIVNLAPSAETTLTFVWNITGLAEGEIYTIRAETSQIPGETDTVDNSLTGSSVQISKTSTPTAPSGFWDTALPYAIPVGAIIASFLFFAAVAVLRRQNKQMVNPVEAEPSELQPLIGMTGVELPDAYSVMIVGDASAGKSVLCQHLAHKYLNQETPCVYVTYDCFPDEIRENMKGFGWDISASEQNENFIFIDCYSSIAGKSSREKYFVKQPFALSELGIVMSTATSALKQKSARVFLDSTAPLFTRLESTKVVEFLQDRSAQIKGENGIFFFIVGKGTLQEDLRRRLEEIVDCIIHLEVHDEKGETVRKMRIKKLRGRRFSDQWVSFKIDMRKGFVLSVPKHSQKSQK